MLLVFKGQHIAHKGPYILVQLLLLTHLEETKAS